MAKNAYIELEKYKNKIAALEKKLKQQSKRLADLPAKLGFKTVEDLIEALKSVSTESKSEAPKKAAKKTRKRAKITPKVEAEVKALVAKKMTGAAIAKKVGISLPSVGNIKKRLGLVAKK